MSALATGVGWDVEVPLIAKRDLEVFKAEGLEVRSSHTVRDYLIVLRRFFAWLHQNGWIRRNPTVGVALPPAVERQTFIAPELVEPVLKACWELVPGVAPMLACYMLGGWRKAEIINLRRCDVNLEDGWAYVLDFEGDELTAEWSPKTKASRRAVALHPVLVETLRRVEPVTRPDGSESPWMFPVLDPRKRRRFRDKKDRMQPCFGDRRSPNTSFLNKKLKEVLADKGLQHRTIHDLRRTFSVLLQEAGAPDSIIGRALGHQPEGVTRRNYLPRRNPAIKEWVNKIPVRWENIAPADPSAVAEPENAIHRPGATPEIEVVSEEHCVQSAYSSEPPALSGQPPALRWKN